MEKKIVMIMPYFGKWPCWIELFLYSCSRNDFIDFYFITDCPIPFKIYSNTKFISTDWKEYCAYISEVLGIDFKHKNGYKLCDVRPFYGILHKDIIKNYEFWGWGDMDLCYGDLSCFYCNDILKHNDVFSTHADRMSGHFMIVRNCKKYVDIIPFKLHDWKKRLMDERVLGIDEHDFTFLIYQRIIWIHRLYRYIGKPLSINYYLFFNFFTPIFTVGTKIRMKEFKTSYIPKNGEKWIYDIESGKMYMPTGEELPYLHYLFFKKTPFYRTDNYWRDDFWKVPKLDYSQAKGKIVFDNHYVTYSPSE